MTYTASMHRGLDAATVLTPFAKKIAAAGFYAVGRYLKSLTATEIAALHAAGLGVWPIYETTADRALGGAAAGREDGAKVMVQMKALGAPNGTGVFFTVDNGAGKNTDVDRDGVKDAQEAAEYFLAAKSMLFGTYRCGDYADGDVLTTLDDAVAFPWLPGAMGWSGSRAYDATDLWAMKQGPTLNHGGPWADLDWPDLGFPYDPNLIAREIGAWMPPAGAAVPAPAAPRPAPPAVDIGTLVANLQVGLQAIGLYKGHIDKDPGPATLAALTAWRNQR